MVNRSCIGKVSFQWFSHITRHGVKWHLQKYRQYLNLATITNRHISSMVSTLIIPYTSSQWYKLTLHFHSQTRHKSNMHNTQKKSREKEARPLLPPEFLYLLRLHIAQISSESRLCNIPLDSGNTATAKDSISYQTKGKCRTQITKLGCIIATNRMIT